MTKSTSKKPPHRRKSPAKAALSKALVKPKVRAAAKPTLGSLHKTIAALEARMKRTDALTRKSVAALESSVEALGSRSKKDSTAQKAALTRKVNQLSAKLTDMAAQTQADVSAELKSVLDNPTAEGLQAALTRADQRLSESEAAQATAIAKINRHLANLATAIDARFKTEEDARKAASAVLSERIEIIETDSAAAFGQIGDKMAQITDELKKHGEAGSISIREKVSEIALQTQTEFEQYRANLDRRVEGLEQSVDGNNAADAQRLERMMNGLASRIEELEYGIANIPEQVAEHQQTEQAAYIEENRVQEHRPAQVLGVAGASAMQAKIMDAFTPAPLPSAAAPAAPPNPYLTEVPKTDPPPPEREAHMPLEFDPATMLPTPQPVQTPPQASAPPAAHHFDAADPPAGEPLTQQSPPPFTPSDNTPPALNMPYADPAYAEGDPTMDKARIGGPGPGTGKLGDKLSNLPKLTGRNLRIAALATGVAVIGLIAIKGLMGGDKAPTDLTAAAPIIEQGGAPVSIPTAVQNINAPNITIAPIGDYADNRAVNIPAKGEAAKTLTAAVSAGNKIAQFQLGLSYLEQGRTDEGVDLIRKSANQNQPAAQYRLAKLYEIGEGVAQDSEMARQLTERAARNGNRIAMHDLALYYAEGRGGVKTDLPTAAKWFEKAAERGVVDSQFNLGVLFESGQGLPKNVPDAFVWYSIAATQGDQFAKTRVGVLSDTLPEADVTAAAARAAKFTPVKIDEAANGIFRNVPWAKVNNEKARQVTQVRRAQQLLTEIGFDIGGADGSIGPRTKAAIISFERSNSLPETGRVNTDLIDRLELASGA